MRSDVLKSTTQPLPPYRSTFEEATEKFKQLVAAYTSAWPRGERSDGGLKLGVTRREAARQAVRAAGMEV